MILGENTFCALMHKNNTNAKLILNLRRLEHAYKIVYLLELSFSLGRTFPLYDISGARLLIS
jgi:hypothetical protein